MATSTPLQMPPLSPRWLQLWPQVTVCSGFINCPLKPLILGTLRGKVESSQGGRREGKEDLSRLSEDPP